MTLRHKLVVRAAVVAALLASIGWLLVEGSLRAFVSVGVAALVVISTFLGSVVVRDDVVLQRGLLGWLREPVRLEELTAVSLRNRAGGSLLYWPLTLELTGQGAARVSIDCWAWNGWQELAHRVGHFARQLDAKRDQVTGRHMDCTTVGCPLEAHAAEVAGGRRAGAPPDESLAGLTWREAVAGIALAAAFGFVVGFVGFSVKDEPDTTPLQMAFVMGGFYGGLVAVGLVCAKVYRRFFRRSPPNRDRPPRRW